jgi:branched-chain amino acid aminotransferase
MSVMYDDTETTSSSMQGETKRAERKAPLPSPPLHSEGREQKPLAWFDGRLVDVDALQAGLTTHALHYGSGVFEGIRAYATADGGAAVFRLPEHLQRMHKGAALLGLAFDPAQATAAVLATLRANGHRDAYVRPLAWCGEGSFGLDVEGHAPHMMVATTATQVHLNGSRARLGVTSWRRNPADSLPPLKLCGGYVNSILAKREAKSRGFDEALFTDRAGNVVECTGANVFMVKDGAITAIEHPDALPGITRDSLLALTGANARMVALEELLDADEVFACGTAAEVAPIAWIEDREFGANPVTRAIAAHYQRVVRGEDAACRHWLTTV